MSNSQRYKSNDYLPAGAVVAGICMVMAALFMIAVVVGFVIAVLRMK